MADSLGTIGETYVDVRADFSKLKIDFNSLSGEMGTHLEKMGRDLTGIGTTLTKGLTLPIMASAAAVAAAAIDWQSAWAGVTKTVDDAGESTGALAMQFREMAKTIPVSTNELAAIGEAAGALGIKKENVTEFTRVMAEMGVTTNLTSTQAADAFARIANVMQMPQDQFRNLASAVVALGNAGAATEQEIVNMAVNIAGAGATVGMSAAQVVGFASALSSVGIEAEAGGSAISRVLMDISKAVASGGPQLDEFARVAGTTSEKFAKAFKEDAATATAQFVTGLGRIKTEGENVFGVLDGLELRDIRVQRALLNASNAGKLFTDHLKLGSDAFRENTALTDEANKRFETMASRLTTLWNRVKDAAITIGAALMPAMEKGADALGMFATMLEKASNIFAGLPGPIQGMIVAMLGFAAAIGPVLVAVGAVATGIGGLMTLSPLAVTALTAVGSAFAGLAVKVLALTPHLLAFTVAAASVVAIGKALRETWGLMQDRAEQARLAVEQQKSHTLALAEASRVAKREITDVAEANAILRMHTQQLRDEQEGQRAEQERVNKAAADAAARSNTLSAALLRTKTEVAGLTTEQKRSIAAGIEMGKTEADIAKAVGVSEEAITLYKKQIDALADAEEKRAKAARKWLEEQAGLESKIRSENAAFAKQAIEENDAKLKAEREYYNAKFEAEIKAVEAKKNQTEEEKKILRQYYNWLGERQMEEDARRMEMAKNWENTWKDISQRIPQTILSALQGGGDAVAAVGSMVGTKLADTFVAQFGTKITGALGETLGGAINAILPGVGALLGPLMGKIAGMFGPSQEELAARDKVKEFETQLQSLLTTQQRAAAGNESWKMTVIAVRDAYMALGKTETEALSIVQRLWESSRNGGKDTAAIIAEINAVMEEYKAQMATASEQATVDFGNMRTLAQQYGIDLAGLGPAFQSAMLSQAANKIYEDFMTLKNGGADVGTVLVGMKDEIVALVQDAAKFGIALPRSLEPIITNLMESNQLTEDQREMFKTVSELSWSEPVVGQQQDVNTALEDGVAAVDGINTGLSNMGAIAQRSATSAADAIRNALLPALEEAEDAVNAFNFGHSPGGLKEAAILAPKQAFAVGMMAAAMVADFAMVEDRVNSVNDALAASYDPVMVSARAFGTDAELQTAAAAATRGAGRAIEIPLVVDGRELARATLRNTESVLNGQGVRES